jgi:putative inorganic carbon (HCO3(-)) transporter
VMIERLRGTGIFGDPNDFGLVLVCGCVLCCAFLFRPAAGWRRYMWLMPTCLILSAFSLTYSRGAMLAMMCVIPALVAYRSGAKVAMTSLLVLPFIAMIFSGRMTDLSAIDQGTGQGRIQIWSESLAIWRQYPMFGLGEGLLVEELNVVSHNSFIHCFAELGALGGTAFLASFLAAGLSLWSIKRYERGHESPAPLSEDSRDLSNMRMFAFAMLVAYAAGLLTLSRQLVTPTYLVLGFATAAHQVGANCTNPWRIGNRLIVTAIGASTGFLFVSYLIVRLLVRW